MGPGDDDDIPDDILEPDPDEVAQRHEYPLARDPKTDEAKAAIVRHVGHFSKEVFYSRQLEVHLEVPFFHWITNRAVRELVRDGVFFRPNAVQLRTGPVPRFLVRPTQRYFLRALKRSAALVARYSDHNVGRANGRYAEVLFQNALARRGFRPVGENTNAYQGQKWTETDEDLDFILTRDGIAYGVEVKNTLDYIERPVLKSKLAI